MAISPSLNNKHTVLILFPKILRRQEVLLPHSVLCHRLIYYCVNAGLIGKEIPTRAAISLNKYIY